MSNIRNHAIDKAVEIRAAGFPGVPKPDVGLWAEHLSTQLKIAEDVANIPQMVAFARDQTRQSGAFNILTETAATALTVEAAINWALANADPNASFAMLGSVANRNIRLAWAVLDSVALEPYAVLLDAIVPTIDARV